MGTYRETKTEAGCRHFYLYFGEHKAGPMRARGVGWHRLRKVQYVCVLNVCVCVCVCRAS